jgi:hypothetical protein
VISIANSAPLIAHTTAPSLAHSDIAPSVNRYTQRPPHVDAPTAMLSRDVGSGGAAANPGPKLERHHCCRRLSPRQHSSRMSLDSSSRNTALKEPTAISTPAALEEGDSTTTRSAGGPADDYISLSSSSKVAGQTVAPFLAKHIPSKYAPLQEIPPSSSSSAKYCYRHRPDLNCRRQADEPSMEQLQKVGCRLPVPDVFGPQRSPI